MSQTLAADVFVDGARYPAGTSPEADVAEKITNPAAWVPEPEPEPDGQPAGNASTDEWRAYATAQGVDVPEDATRAEIRKLLAE